jgi:hypothetical protein
MTREADLAAGRFDPSVHVDRSARHVELSAAPQRERHAGGQRDVAVARDLESCEAAAREERRRQRQDVSVGSGVRTRRKA